MRVFYAAQKARSTHWQGHAISLSTRLSRQAASYVQRLRHGNQQGRTSANQLPWELAISVPLHSCHTTASVTVSASPHPD
jgi:hypothetical protein